MRNILVIEDDHHIAELISVNLTDDETTIQCKYDGNSGYVEATSGDYDLIILDLMLPGKKGMEICRDLRAAKNQTPIIMLTSKSDEIDKILGLETGADDYITKPFSIRELQARITAVLRRVQTEDETNKNQEIYEFKKLLIDQKLRKVELDGQRLNLTPKEYELLEFLAKNPGQTFSRSQLLYQLWGYEFEGYEHTVNSHINRVRSKLEEDPTNPEYILTTWGVGYRFTENLS